MVYFQICKYPLTKALRYHPAIRDEGIWTEYWWSICTLERRIWCPWFQKRISNFNLSVHRTVFHCASSFVDGTVNHIHKQWFLECSSAHAMISKTELYLVLKQCCLSDRRSQIFNSFFLAVSLAHRAVSRFSKLFGFFCSHYVAVEDRILEVNQNFT